MGALPRMYMYKGMVRHLPCTLHQVHVKFPISCHCFQIDASIIRCGYRGRRLAPYPCFKTSQKKDGRRTGSQVLRVIGLPSDKFFGSATVIITVNIWTQLPQIYFSLENLVVLKGPICNAFTISGKSWIPEDSWAHYGSSCKLWNLGTALCCCFFVGFRVRGVQL